MCAGALNSQGGTGTQHSMTSYYPIQWLWSITWASDGYINTSSYTSVNEARLGPLSPMSRFTARSWLISRILLVILLVAGTIEARLITKKDILARQIAAAQRWKPTFASIASVETVVSKNITFSNPKASRTCLPFKFSVWRQMFNFDARILC